MLLRLHPLQPSDASQVIPLYFYGCDDSDFSSYEYGLHLEVNHLSAWLRVPMEFPLDAQRESERISTSSVRNAVDPNAFGQRPNVIKPITSPKQRVFTSSG